MNDMDEDIVDQDESIPSPQPGYKSVIPDVSFSNLESVLGISGGDYQMPDQTPSVVQEGQLSEVIDKEPFEDKTYIQDSLKTLIDMSIDVSKTIRDEYTIGRKEKTADTLASLTNSTVNAINKLLELSRHSSMANMVGNNGNPTNLPNGMAAITKTETVTMNAESMQKFISQAKSTKPT